MFEKASRTKLRFQTTNGALTVEDLWEIPLTSTVGKVNLDDVARALHKQLKSGDDVSFVDTAKKSDPVVQLKFDIVKHVIEVRLAENAAKVDAKAKAEKRQLIMSLMAEKSADALKGKSLAELQAELDSIQ